jgi:hypothetical protein
VVDVQQTLRKEQAMTTASSNHGQVRSGSVGSARATDKLLDRVRGRLTLVGLSRPEKKNAIDRKMIETFRSIFNRLPKEASSRPPSNWLGIITSDQ